VTPAALGRRQRLDLDIEGLLVAASDVRRIWNRELKEFLRERKLSERGLNIIYVVNAGLNRPGLLIDYLDVLPSTVTVEIEKLVAAGLIERRAVPTDRRVTELVLTDQGQAVRRDSIERVNRAFRPRLDHVAAEDLRACVTTLRQVIQPFEPETPTPDEGDAAT
jgi:DNA-binding MarR family transcriptional regulator